MNFVDDADGAAAADRSTPPLVLLIVDDDRDVHDSTRLALGGERIRGRRIEFLHAYSAEEARAVLTGNSTIARTSNTPGRTQEINFFDLGYRLVMADLPGYGFAQAPKDKVGIWTDFIKLYLKGRPTLRRALVLVDSRHSLKDVDRDIMKLMDDSAVNYQIILTKVDKVKPHALAALRESIGVELAKHVAAHPEVLATSAEDGFGIAEVRAVLSELARPE